MEVKMEVMRYAQDNSLAFCILRLSSIFTSCQQSWHNFPFYFPFYSQLKI